MKITAIKQQVKQQGRYSIFVEGKYCFSLSDIALLDSKLVNGQDLTEAEVHEFKKLSLDDKLFNRAVQYVAMRPRSTWEIEFYLQRKKADPLLSQQIVNKLSKFGLLDDEAFAQSWVASRRMLKPVSRRRLQQELRAKHVPSEIVEQVLAEDETDELTTLRQLVERKKAKYTDQTKFMRYLASQGFNYDDIKTALQTED